MLAGDKAIVRTATVSTTAFARKTRVTSDAPLAERDCSSASAACIAAEERSGAPAANAQAALESSS